MNRLFLSLLAISAIVLGVSRAIADGNVNNPMDPANVNGDNGGVVIVETYTSSSVVTPSDNDMQPLPNSNGVEVGPDNSTLAQPVIVEEDVLIQQTEDGE